jgi:glycerol kinase
MSAILAIDQGTSSSRAIVFGADGAVLAQAQRPLALSCPRPGWVETDPQALWESVLASARTAVREAKTGIAAVGITNQRETTVLWERASGQPLHPAIVWQDRRTARACERLRAEGHEAMIRAKTGLLVDPYFSATKLAWLLDHTPDGRRRAAAGELCFGTVDTWLLYRLTSGRAHLTEPSNAARTMLYNIHTGRWDEELLRLFDIPPALLPEVVPSAGWCADTDPAWFGTALPVQGVAGDQQAATFGQACTSPGMAKSTYGTGCFIMAHAGQALPACGGRLLQTVGWRIGERTDYLLEGSVFMGGAIVHWLRDIGVVAGSAEIEALATSVGDSGGVTLVPAFSGLGAPYWDADARAALIGMSGATGRAELARAGLDAIALQCADVLDAMRDDAGIALTELRVDGGACVNNYLMQLQADLLGLPVVRPRVIETTALGAARLAAVGAGAQDDGLAWQPERVFTPAWSEDRRQASLARWRRAVEHVRAWRQEGEHAQ